MKKSGLLSIANTYLFTLCLTVSAAIYTENAKGSIVYDNTTSQATGSFTGGGSERGDQITLAGTDRLVTDFLFGYQGLSVPVDATIRIRFYDNEGVGGEPGSLLYDSGQVGGLQIGINDFMLSGINVIVPDTFTWTMFYDQTIFGGGVNNVMVDPPTVGTSADFVWFRDFIDGSWIQAPFDDTVMRAQVIAISAVPLPPVFWLFGSGLVGLVGIARRKKAA